MRFALALAAAALVAGSVAVPASAKLPPLSDEAKAKAAEAAARSAWTEKVGAYKMCLSMDRVAEVYRTSSRSLGKDAPAPVTMPPCADPGPFVPITPTKDKPLEASGAHSPPGTAVSPPSNNAPAAQIQGPKQ